MAGFPTSPGTFFLPRATLEPPIDLQRRLFPFVEFWELESEVEESLALRGLLIKLMLGFFGLLKYLRVVILQDSVILSSLYFYLLTYRYPEHNLFAHEVFQSNEYQSFKQEVLLF